MVTSISFGILTVSDRCFKGKNKDTSGPKIKEILTKNISFDANIVKQDIVPDESAKIQEKLIDWSNETCDIIITTGGTGFSPRDITPEATKKVIQREAPGLTIAIIKACLDITPFAMLSRLTCGIRGYCLIINLPGSETACEECLEVVLPVLSHVAKQLIGQTDHGKQEKQSMLMEEVSTTANGLNRIRASKFPMVELSTAILSVMFNSKFLNAPRTISISDSYGATIISDLKSTCNVPPCNISKMDGYAVIDGDKTTEKMLIGVCNAGDKAIKEVKIKPGQCYRISTGAIIPAGTNNVVKVEDTECLKEVDNKETEIKFTNLVNNYFIRHKGSDIKENALLMSGATVIGAIEIALMVQAGIDKVLVVNCPHTIGLFSTGNEIIEIGQPLNEEQVYDANRPMLKSLLEEQKHVKVIDFGICPDSYREIKNKLVEAFTTCEIVISTGGVSMGEKDLIKNILSKDFKAKIIFGRVNLKPGKPTTFATLEYRGKQRLYFGLAGNPVSAYVGYHLFIHPIISSFENIEVKFEEQTVLFTAGHKVGERSEIQPIFKVGDIYKCNPIKCSSTIMNLRNIAGLCVLEPNVFYGKAMKVDTMFI